MAYALTSATNWKTLLDAVATFAVANGWTVEYNEELASGKQIGLSSGALKFALGVDAYAYPLARGVDGQTDAAISIVPVAAFGATKNYWSHGTDVNSANDADRVFCNDIVGPLTEVHFFGDDTSIFAAVRSSPARWTHFGFGALNRAGVGVIPFASGQRHLWWRTATNTQDSADGWHAYPFGSSRGPVVDYGQALKVYVPDGVLNPAHGFDGGAQWLNHYSIENTTLLNQMNFNRANPLENRYDDLSSILRPLYDVDFTQTTGGVPLWPIPVIATKQDSSTLCYLGELPTVRVFRSTEYEAGDVIDYGGETFQVFPLKQRGEPGNTSWGGAADGQPNTLDVFYAYRKVF